MSRTFRLVLAASLAFAGAHALAAPATKPMTSQQQRMADCNKQATGKTGDARKAFMSSCLKGKAATAKPTQQQKMKSCNAEASKKSLKGDARKQFMSSCLKG